MSTIEKISPTDHISKLIESNPSPHWGEKERGFALEAFKKQGIPTRKHEEYKYCRLDLILKEGFSITDSPESISKEKLSDLFTINNSIKVFILNGKLNKELSDVKDLPKGVVICDIAEAFEKYREIVQKHYGKYADVQSDPFIALNTAITDGGAFIYVSKKIVVEAPIHIINISSSGTKNILLNPRNLIVAEEFSQMKVLESFVSIDAESKVFNNSLSEIYIGKEAHVHHYKIQDENDLSTLVNTTQVNQEGKSTYTTNCITLNGALVRNNLNIVLAGQSIESNLNGVYIPRGSQVVDNHTLVDHQQPNCNSNELYKGIVTDEATATFNGKIFVRKDAQKTNAFQSNKNILQSDDATVNTKLQLEIYADDVKCSHGTSTGKLDEEQLFYLRARGLGEATAKKLLMFAFISEVVEGIKVAELKIYIEDRLMGFFL